MCVQPGRMDTLECVVTLKETTGNEVESADSWSSYILLKRSSTAIEDLLLLLLLLLLLRLVFQALFLVLQALPLFLPSPMMQTLRGHKKNQVPA